MSDAEHPAWDDPTVAVARECRGPIGGDCDRLLRATVPSFRDAPARQGVRCRDCGRITHVSRRHVLGGDGE